MRAARNQARPVDYEDPPPIEKTPLEQEVDDEGDWADQGAWSHDVAEASRAALGQAAALTNALAEWKPTSHLTYLARASDPGAATKMDIQAKARAIKAYAETGVKKIAASAAGVCLQTLANHMKEDEDLVAAMEEARQEYCTRMQLWLFQRGYVGTPKPIVGRIGKDQDGIIGYELVRSDNIALALAKAHMPELFVEKLQVEATVQAGVLVVGAPMTLDAWYAKHGGQKELPPMPLLDQVRRELEQK